MIIEVGADQAGMRLDAVLRASLPELSRSRIQKAIRSGCCKGPAGPMKDPALKTHAGWKLDFVAPAEESGLMPSDGDIRVLWEDADVAICMKPAGLTVHPCPSCAGETFANRLLARFPQLAAQGGERPGIVHRLDKDTSGLMIVALTERARLRLTEDFAARKIKKEYLALVAGIAPATGASQKPIGRDPQIKTRMAIVDERHGGRHADTEWRRVWHNDAISLLEVKIHTGRTHQIRLHLATEGFPVIGDGVYGTRKTAALAPRQMLHAWRLEFSHPVSGEELQFTLPPPDDFFEAIMANNQTGTRIVVTGNQGCGKSSFCEDLRRLGLPVISADEIVAELYSSRSEAGEWIGSHLGDDLLTDAGKVDKAALFRALQERPEMKRELETVVHGLVLARIESFWQENRAAFAVAEIPLYFESGYPERIRPAPFVVGISCPEEDRWQRIAANRGWSREKIITLESWQWPEDRKMAACDVVIANNGNPAQLADAAAAFIRELESAKAGRDQGLLAKLGSFCASPRDLRKG